MCVLPVRFLEKNKVPGTENVRFEVKGHHYFAYNDFLGVEVSTKEGHGTAPIISTTTLLKDYFPSPDFDEIAARVWNHEENRHKMEHDVTYKYFGCKSIEDIKAIWAKGAVYGTKMHEHFEDLCNLIEYDKQQQQTHDQPIIMNMDVAKTCTNTNAPTIKDVLEQAKGTHEKSLRLGTMMHLYAQKRLEGYTEKQYFVDFVTRFKLYDPNGRYSFYRTELMLYHNVLNISGMIDCLLYDKQTDSYVIVDWKRCKGGVKGDPKNPKKKVHELPPKYRGARLPAFEALRNHNYNKYGCQLTMYKNMFEQMTGKRVSAMYLVVVDSAKMGRRDALSIQPVPVDKFQHCIVQVCIARANHILSSYQDTLPDNLMDELIEYLKEDEQPPIKKRKI